MSSRRKKIIASIVFATLLMATGPSNFASTDPKDQVSEKPMDINFIILREGMVKDSKEIRTLDEQIKSLSEGISGFDSGFKYLLMMGTNLTGGKEQRKGHYYEYAYPNFVQIEHMRAQLEELIITREALEIQLNFASDSALANHQLLLKQEELYEKMIKKSEKSFEGIQKKYKLGTLSKLNHDTSKIELENLKLEKEKIAYQIEISKLNLMSTAGLPLEKPSFFSFPVFTDSDFDEKLFNTYYNDAISANRKLYLSTLKKFALDNEQKYMKDYKPFILKSDLLDFEKRREEALIFEKNSRLDVYSALRKELDGYNTIMDALQVAKDQAQYDTHFLKKLKQLEDKGQIVDTERLSYEIKIFQNEISQSKLKNDKLMQIVKLHLLIYNGIIL